MSDERPAEPSSTSVSRRLQTLVLVAAVVLVFANTLHNAYHLDDFYRIVGNPELERVWPPWRHFFDPSTIATLPTIVQYRPMLPLSLSMTTWASDAIGIERLLGHHIGNVAIHLVSVLLLRRLVTRIAMHLALPFATGLGFASALLFAVHPVSGVPVTYLCARDLLLMQAFLLGSLLVFVRMRIEGATPLRWIAALGLLTLSILSKTDPVVAPGLILVLDACVFAAPLRSLLTWARAGAFALPIVAFFIFTELIMGFSDADQLVVERDLLEYPLTQARLHVFYYLRNAVWPFRMRPLPAVEPASGLGEPAVLVGLAFIAATLGIAWHVRRCAPLVAACIGCYWIAFGATSWVLPFRYLATDYRQYPSLPWLCTLGAYAVLAWCPRREALVSLGLLAAYLAGATLLMNRLWREPVSLWGQSVRHGGEVMAHVNFALAIQSDDPERAEAHYHEALRRAPGNVFAHINLGLLEISERRFDQGIARLEHAHALAPTWPITREWLDRGCGRAVALAGMATSPALERCRQRPTW
jgi:protein O-mannosyl-transferase